jgi:1D-myo-inositol 3-kinase
MPDSLPEVLVAGNYCHDTLVTRWGVHRVLGGSVAYISAVLRGLAVPFRTVAKVGGDFLYAAQVAAAPLVVAGARTTGFVDDYTGGERTETLEARCEPIYPADLAHLPRVRIAIAGAIASEIPPETLWCLRARSDVVLADAQGLLRTFGPRGEVRLQPLAQTPFAPHVRDIDVLKVSRSEAPFIDLAAVRRHTVVLLTDGALGCTILERGRETHVAALPAHVLDATGAGDCFLAGFAVGLLRGLSTEKAAHIASFCGARAVEQVGVPALSAAALEASLAVR